MAGSKLSGKGFLGLAAVSAVIGAWVYNDMLANRYETFVLGDRPVVIQANTRTGAMRVCTIHMHAGDQGNQVGYSYCNKWYPN